MSEKQTSPSELETGSTFRIPAVDLNDLIESPDVQIRRKSKARPLGVDPDVVEQYAKDMLAGVTFPDVHAAATGAAKSILFDGFTRVAALRRAAVLLENAKKFNEDKSWNGRTEMPTLGGVIHRGKFTVSQLQYK